MYPGLSVPLGVGLSGNDPPAHYKGYEERSFRMSAVSDLSVDRWVETHVVGWGDEVMVTVCDGLLTMSLCPLLQISH